MIDIVTMYHLFVDVENRNRTSIERTTHLYTDSLIDELKRSGYLFGFKPYLGLTEKGKAARVTLDELFSAQEIADRRQWDLDH